MGGNSVEFITSFLGSLSIWVGFCFFIVGILLMAAGIFLKVMP